MGTLRDILLIVLGMAINPLANHSDNIIHGLWNREWASVWAGVWASMIGTVITLAAVVAIIVLLHRDDRKRRAEDDKLRADIQALINEMRQERHERNSQPKS